MPPKPPKKTAAVLAAEALEQWTAQEAEWTKLGIVLRHTLAEARAYLAQEEAAREALVEKIESEAQKRAALEKQTEAQQRETAGKMVEAQRRVRELEARLAAQSELLLALRDEKSAVEEQIRRRCADHSLDDSLAALRDETDKIDWLISHFRTRIIAFRRAEDQAQALEKAAGDLFAKIVAAEAPFPFGFGQEHVVIFGDALTAATVRYLDEAQPGSPLKQFVVTRVLGTPRSVLDTTFATGTVNGSTYYAASLHREFVTQLPDAAGYLPSQHYSDVLRSLAPRLRGTQSLLLFAGSQLDSARPELLALDTDRKNVLDLRELLMYLQEVSCSLVLAIDSISDRPHQGWSMLLLPNFDAPLAWTHRSDDSMIHHPLSSVILGLLGQASRDGKDTKGLDFESLFTAEAIQRGSTCLVPAVTSHLLPWLCSA